MHLSKYHKLNNDLKHALFSLVKSGQDCDKMEHPFYFCDEDSIIPMPCAYTIEDEKGVFISALTVYFISPECCQIYAATAPCHRMKGCFKMLYNEFLSDAKLYSVNEIIIPILPENNIGKSIVSNLSNIYKVETEYILIYDCSVNASDFGNSYYNAEHLDFNDEEFLYLLGKVQIGKCKIEISDTNASLYEFEIFEEYRNKGYGSAFLSEITDYLSGKGVKKILLQVSGANTPAYKMYMHHGFKIYSSLDMFTLFVR